MKKRKTLKEEKMTVDNKLTIKSKMPARERRSLRERGITLVALVVTIIILLILAGVAVGAITGDNGLFRKTKEVTTLSKIADVEEEARMIYSELILDEQLRGEEASFSKLVDELEEKGYIIEQKVLGEVSAISIDNNSLTVKVGETGTIKVTYEGASGGMKYYVKIDDKYYEISKENGNITISREAQEIEAGGAKLDVKITAGEDKITVKEEGNNIKVTAGENTGSATITITYGAKEPVTCNVTIIKMPTEATTPTNTEPTFSTDYGRIDVVWLEGNSNKVSKTNTANTPNLYTGENRLSPVTWTQDAETKNWSEDGTAKSTWYDYSETNRYWANAKNSDDSYFVWIPRYAYRITYYSDAACTKVTGYYDGYGMYDAINGTLNYKVDEGIETADYNGMKYIVHPAFTGIGKEDIGGGFGTDANGITGFWVAKFETSRENSSDGINWTIQGTKMWGGGNELITDATKIRAVSKPYRETSKVSSWRGINIGNCYLNSYNYDRNKESHLMKNSEWGAVAYLTHSKYGRNGEEITINNNESYYTGIAGSSVSASSSSDATNTFETKAGTLASTTGNVYGIYDMSGGAYEYTACFNKLGDSSKLTGSSYGKSMIDTVSKDAEGNYLSNKYITAYSNENSSGGSTAIVMSVGKTGDATKEVRKGSTSAAWNGNYSYVPETGNPFALRGGDYGYNSASHGVFYATRSDGVSSDNSFRVVLA